MLNRHEDRQLRNMLADRDTLRRLVNRLTDDALTDLHRRGAQVAGCDGYPAGGDATGGSGPGMPTEVAAIALAEGSTQRDNVGRWIAEVLAYLSLLAVDAARIQVSIDGALEHVAQINNRLLLLEKAGWTGRINLVELCAECNEPAPRVKRLDGQPYHPGACWMRAYRRTGRDRGFGEAVTG